MTAGEVWAARRDAPQVDPPRRLTWREAVKEATTALAVIERRRSEQAIREAEYVMRAWAPADQLLIIDWINDDWANVVLVEDDAERVLAQIDFDIYGGEGMRSALEAVTAVAVAAGLPVEIRGEVGR